MPVQLITNWSKGLWTAGPPPKAPQGALTRMVNVQVLDEGTVSTRYGCSTELILANTIDGAYVADTHFYKVTGGAIYDATGVAIGISQTGNRLRVASMPSYGIPNDIIFFPQPTGIYMKKYYNGTVSNWGISETPVAPVATAGAAGIPSGTFSYRFAFYSSTTLCTSALSAISNELTVTSKQIVVSNIPLVCVDSQATHVNIYRSTQSSSASEWYYLTRVVLGSTATYTDNAADLDLGDQVNPSITHPPVGNLAGRFGNRMLLLDTTENPRFVFASMPSQPEVFNTLYYDLVLNAGDTAEAVLQIGQYAYVWGRNNVYQFSIDSNNLITITVLPNVPGTPNGRTVAMGTQGAYYHGYDGIYLLSGFSQLQFPGAQKISLNIDALFRNNDRGGLSLISDDSTTSGSFVGGRYHFSYYGTDNMWHTVIFNESYQRWKHFTGWHYTVAPTAGTYPLVGLSSVVGSYDPTTTTDAGSSFVSSCGFTMGLPTTVLHCFRNFRISAECAGTLTVALYDGDTEMYSVGLSSSIYTDGYFKHSYPLGTYCLQPEVRVSSSSAFALRTFEVNVDPVRKETGDYSVAAQALQVQTRGG